MIMEMALTQSKRKTRGTFVRRGEAENSSGPTTSQTRGTVRVNQHQEKYQMEEDRKVQVILESKATKRITAHRKSGM